MGLILKKLWFPSFHLPPPKHPSSRTLTLRLHSTPWPAQLAVRLSTSKCSNNSQTLRPLIVASKRSVNRSHAKNSLVKPKPVVRPRKRQNANDGKRKSAFTGLKKNATRSSESNTRSLNAWPCKPRSLKIGSNGSRPACHRSPPSSIRKPREYRGTLYFPKWAIASPACNQ